MWSLFAFIGVHGNRIPGPSLMPHRFWSILSIPLVLLCAWGIFKLGTLTKKINIPNFILFSAVIIGIIITSGYPKYVVETSNWPPGIAWGSMDELSGYLSLKSITEGSRILPICADERKIIAFDHIVDFWDPSFHTLVKSPFNNSVTNIHSYLKSKNYNYVTIDSTCVRKYGVNATNQALTSFTTSGYFKLVNKNKGFFLFSVL